MPRKLVFVVDPQSLGGSTGRDWPALGAALRAQLGDSGTHFMEKTMEGTGLTRHALQPGADVVVAVGGDGSVQRQEDHRLRRAAPLRGDRLP